MQLLHRMGSDWTLDGHVYLHHAPNVHIDSVKAILSGLYLRTTSNVDIWDMTIAAISTKI